MAYIGRKPTSAALTSSDVADAIITNAKLAQDIISADTALGAEPADTDEFLVSDAGTLKRVDYSYIKGGVDGVSSSADATAMTITSGELIGIGETSPMALVHIKQADSGMASVDTNTTQLLVEDDSTAGLTLLGGTSGACTLYFGDGDDNDIGSISYDHGGNTLNFNVQGDDAMRIDGSRNIFITKTSASDTASGNDFNPNGSIHNVLNAQGYNIFNRQSDDGTLIYFKQANSSEGSIAVSGSTVSYNGFTGTHWTRLADNSKPTILKGTVLESLDEMVDWYNLEFNDSKGEPQKITHLLTGSQSAGDKITYDHNGTDYEATIVKEADIKHVKSKVSDTSEAKNVYGVFSYWDFGDDDGINDIIVASVGTYVVRIHKDETVAKGDLLQSNGDGTAKKQSDDNVKSSSFAKVLSTTKIETYDDGSFIVPCSLNC